MFRTGMVKLDVSSDYSNCSVIVLVTRSTRTRDCTGYIDIVSIIDSPCESEELPGKCPYEALPIKLNASAMAPEYHEWMSSPNVEVQKVGTI